MTVTADTFGRIRRVAYRHAMRWRAKSRQSILRWQFSPNPHMGVRDKAVVDDLFRTGIHITTLAEMGFDGTDRLIADGQRLCAQLRGMAPDSRHVDAQPFMVLADPVELARNSPEMLLWGLQDRILDIVEAYLQQRTHCLGVFLRRDLADGGTSGTRTWHKDGKDLKYLKIIIYLTDIGEDCGPFEYAPENGGAADHRAITGPAGTVFFVDTARLSHRGRVPVQERFALFYSYATRSPSNPASCARGQFLPGLAHLDAPLTDRQHKSLPWHIKPKS